jgi:hypothetical protein
MLAEAMSPLAHSEFSTGTALAGSRDFREPEKTADVVALAGLDWLTAFALQPGARRQQDLRASHHEFLIRRNALLVRRNDLAQVFRRSFRWPQKQALRSRPK